MVRKFSKLFLVLFSFSWLFIIPAYSESSDDSKRKITEDDVKKSVSSYQNALATIGKDIGGDLDKVVNAQTALEELKKGLETLKATADRDGLESNPTLEAAITTATDQIAKAQERRLALTNKDDATKWTGEKGNGPAQKQTADKEADGNKEGNGPKTARDKLAEQEAAKKAAEEAKNGAGGAGAGAGAGAGGQGEGQGGNGEGGGSGGGGGGGGGGTSTTSSTSTNGMIGEVPDGMKKVLADGENAKKDAENYKPSDPTKPTVDEMNRINKSSRSKTGYSPSFVSDSFNTGRNRANPTSGGTPLAMKGGGGGVNTNRQLPTQGASPGGSYSGGEQKLHGYLKTALTGGTLTYKSKSDKAALKLLKSATVVGKPEVQAASGSTKNIKNINNPYANERGLTLNQPAAVVNPDQPIGYAFMDEVPSDKEGQLEPVERRRQPANSSGSLVLGGASGHQQR